MFTAASLLLALFAITPVTNALRWSSPTNAYAGLDALISYTREEEDPKAVTFVLKATGTDKTWPLGDVLDTTLTTEDGGGLLRVKIPADVDTEGTYSLIVHPLGQPDKPLEDFAEAKFTIRAPDAEVQATAGNTSTDPVALFTGLASGSATAAGAAATSTDASKIVTSATSTPATTGTGTAAGASATGAGNGAGHLGFTTGSYVLALIAAAVGITAVL